MPEVDHSMSSNEARPDDGIPSGTPGGSPNAGFTFVAPASDELGGEVTVAVLVNGIGPGGDASELLAADAIRQSFLSTPTGEPFQAVTDAFKRANDAILARRPATAGQPPTGCSATIALITGERVFVGNVGDNRVYFFRETEIESLAADQSWVHEAMQSWRFKPGDIQEHDDAQIPRQYLGKEEGVTPRFAPIEFLGLGDTLMLCTAALASRVRENEMHDIVAGSEPSEASQRLIQAAVDRGAVGSLTNVILQVPRAATTYESIPLPERAGSRLSPVAVALILGNLLLLCIIVAFLLGAPSFLASLRTVEVALPVFGATPALTPSATPTPGLDVGATNLTPTIPSSEPAPAPTALPGSTPTPPGVPTFTPQPSPANWVAPPAPPLIVPADGFVFEGQQAQVILEWRSVGSLPEDVFYVVSIKKWVDGKYIGESLNWTKSNRIRLDSSFYTAFKDGPQRLANAAPLLAGAVDQFEWSVAIYRLTLIKPDGSIEGVPLSQPTSSRRFTWGPALPTRVYGG